MSDDHSIEELDTFNDQKLMGLDWRNLLRLNGRLLELHGEGALGNEKLAKLPLRPILCIDQIETIDDDTIEASFTFPDSSEEWAFDPSESLEMLFQDQLDQLVGFWGCRKADGIGRALSSGACKLHQSLDYKPGESISFHLEKRKWMKNKSAEGGTAVFNGRILDSNQTVLLETKNVIVGILRPQDIDALRERFGGTLGVENGKAAELMPGLRIPVYDLDSVKFDMDADLATDSVGLVSAIQKINQDLWPLRYHFRGDPVVPGNFGTHGMISLLKQTARDQFSLKDPIFKSLDVKKFSGMIFENPKQIRFELKDVGQNSDGQVVAALANLYLEDEVGAKMIEAPIYTFKNLTVTERTG